MKINRIRTILAVLVMAAVLGGCVGKDHYNTSQMKAVIERGKPMLEAFISTLHEDDVTIGEYSMADGIIEGGLLYSGSYLSRAVYVEFSANGKNYKALVNTEDGKIWTDYYMFDLNEQIKRQMEPYCERYGFSGDFKIEGASTYSVLHFKDVETNDFTGENADTYVLIEDLISSVYNDEDVLKRADEFLKDAPLDSFSVVYEATDGAVFDPRILADYLVETGNYKAEDTRSRVKGEYRINGEVVSDIEELMKRQGAVFDGRWVMAMHVGQIMKADTANGVGIRVSVFVSGCTNACEGCFNKATWDFNYGEEYTAQMEQMIMDELKKPFYKGLTILGGEPFELANQRECVKLIRRVRAEAPDKNIWMYTGFTYETDLCPGGKRYCEVTDEILAGIDILVDGKYEQSLRNLMLKFRGSSNQRIIDVKKSISSGKVVLSELNN